MAAFLGDNAVSYDPAEREASLREKVPDLLKEGETVVLAYKDRGGKGRDSSSFTNKRILIKDKKGMSGKKTQYISIPYAAIRAYSIETAGSMDSDVELKVYASGFGRIAMDFTTDTDIFALHEHLNEMVLVGAGAGKEASGDVIASEDAPTGEGVSSGGNIFDMMGDNATQIDASAVEAQLKSNPKVLVPSESVELAFKCGRDSFLLTSHRILRIDVQGMSGKRIEYLTILWKSVKAYSVETAGGFLDSDSELCIFFNTPDVVTTTPGMARKSKTRLGIDFKKGKADIFAVQRFFADKLLGPDTVDESENAVSMAGQEDTGSDSILAWCGDDCRMIDAGAMDRQYHSNPRLLQSCEKVEMAFKGRRDMVLFTSKRLIFVDVKGFMGIGKKVEYTSIPWTTVTAYGVKSAGSFMDKDSEMMIWTEFDDVFYPPKENEDDPPPPPISRQSYFELDFQKDKVDLMAVHRYLSERCLRVEGGGGKMVDGVYVPDLRPYDLPVSPDVMAPSAPSAMSKFMGFLGDDASAIDPEALDAQMHDEEGPLLQADEKVVLAYKNGRDSLIFTSKRIFIIDVQGFSGKRVSYVTVPYTSVRSYAVESAGSWDSDAELKIWTKCYWMDGSPGNKIKQDLRKGKADIVAIQSYLSQQVLGGQDGSTSLKPDYTATEAGGVETFLTFLSDNAAATNPAEVEETLRSTPPILQADESVENAYKLGRDMCVFTTKRILLVDRQGISGKRVEYKTLPLRYAQAFAVQTAGKFLSSPEVTVYCDGTGNLNQDLSKSSSDIWAVQTILANKILS